MSDFNYRFLTALALEHGRRVLDYGCGAGRLMSVAAAAGLDIYGCDTFAGHYGGWDAQATDDVARRIRKIENGGAPWAAETFDVVISNQVLEHVDDPEFVISDMGRVLKPKGVILAAFPVITTAYEGHLGLYGAHWLPPGRFRHAYFKMARTLGFGLYDRALSPDEWARASAETLDTTCRYYTLDRLLKPLQRVGKVEDISDRYMRERVAALHSLPRPILRRIYSFRAGKLYRVCKS